MRARVRDARTHTHTQTDLLAYLHFKLVADITSIELRTDQFELPVKQGHDMPVAVPDQVQNHLIAGHGINP